MNPLVLRAILRGVALILESTRWASPGTFENLFGDATLEPLFFLLISETWFWYSEKGRPLVKKVLDKLRHLVYN